MSQEKRSDVSDIEPFSSADDKQVQVPIGMGWSFSASEFSHTNICNNRDKANIAHTYNFVIELPSYLIYIFTFEPLCEGDLEIG